MGEYSTNPPSLSGGPGSAISSISSFVQNPFQKSVTFPERQPDFPGGFQILEYVNDKAPSINDNEHFVCLMGTFSPTQPFEWESEQHIVKDYYPNNPDPSIQVLGTREKAVVIHGKWRSKKLKDPALYAAPYWYAELMDRIKARGNLLRLQWMGNSGKWIRYGYLSATKYKMNKLAWVEYELTFEICGRTKPVNNYFLTSAKIIPDTANTKLMSDLNKVLAMQSVFPVISVPQSVADLLNTAISGVMTQVNLVTGFVSALITAGTAIESSIATGLGIIANAKAAISVLRRQLGQLGFGYSNISSAAAPSSQAATASLNIQAILEIIAGMGSISTSLSSLQNQLSAITVTTPDARYVVKANDTLQTISMAYYNTADYWSNIYFHNNLQSVNLTVGQVLELPALT